MYELMVLMKAMDDRMFWGASSGEFIANYFPFRGQEAIPAVMGVVLRDGDQLVTTYRGIHDHIGKGVPLDDILAEVLGKRTAPSGGKGGSYAHSQPRERLHALHRHRRRRHPCRRRVGPRGPAGTFGPGRCSDVR